MSAAFGNDVFEIALEAVADDTKRRVIFTNLLIEEHLHTTPFAPAGWSFPETRNPAFDQLTDPRGLESKGGASNRLGARAPNTGPAKWTHYFIVAHVDDPNISLARSAIAGDLPDSVGIDASHPHVNDFELLFGKAPGQQGIKHSR